MNIKFYVSLEAARLLKEKGYNKPTDYIYVIDGQFYSIWRNKDGNIESNYYPAPTKAEAIDWLESKGMSIVVIRRTIDNEVGWRYVIYNQTEIISGFSTRLEAEEAAIIKALELL
jgi:hypothetical protein